MSHGWEALDDALVLLAEVMGAALSHPPTDLAVESVLGASSGLMAVAAALDGTDSETVAVQALALNCNAVLLALMPSKYGYGTTAREAMAASVPATLRAMGTLSVLRQ